MTFAFDVRKTVHQVRMVRLYLEYADYVERAGMVETADVRRRLAADFARAALASFDEVVREVGERRILTDVERRRLLETLSDRLDTEWRDFYERSWR